VEGSMNALAGFVERTDFWWRLKRTFLFFGVPIFGVAIVLTLATTIAYWFAPPAPVEQAPPGAPPSGILAPSEPATRPLVQPSLDRVPMANNNVDVTLSAGVTTSSGDGGVALSGTIEKIDGKTIFVKTSEGRRVIKLADDAKITAITKAVFGAGGHTYVGTFSTPKADGSKNMMEVHMFPEDNGFSDFVPQSMVANANAETLFTMKYTGIVVPNNVPIVRFGSGSRGDLKPGARISVGAANSDGTIKAITVDKVGVDWK
jgi:hypothetical protein